MYLEMVAMTTILKDVIMWMKIKSKLRLQQNLETSQMNISYNF